MTAVILAFASAGFLGGGIALTQFGLRHVNPLSGAAISIPTFTLLFLCLSPILLYGETIVWPAVPLFAAVGLVFPAVLTLLSFASNRVLGPVITGALGNVSPIFAVAVAVFVLHEPPSSEQLVGLVVVVAGILILTVTNLQDLRRSFSWALLLPLAAAALRGFIQPAIKVGLEMWPNPIAGGLIGYIFSSATVLMFERIRNGRFLTQAPWTGRLWFAGIGICNGVGTLLMYAALDAGPVTLVAPLVATYPLMTLGLSALVLDHLKVTPRLVIGTAITVAGVVLILADFAP